MPLQCSMTEPNYQSLYTQLGRLVADTPTLSDWQASSRPENLKWFARALALVELVGAGNGFDATTVRATLDTLSPSLWPLQVTKINGIIYRAMAVCEVHLPASAAGAFVPAGDVFDAFAALTKLFETAKSDILIVDPYLDESVLVDFGGAVPLGINVRLLADQQSVKATFAPAVTKWRTQYGLARPLEARLTQPKVLHDRAIFIDRTEAWTLTQSLKDFAKKSPAELVRANDVAALKIAAYEAIWTSSMPL